MTVAPGDERKGENACAGKGRKGGDAVGGALSRDRAREASVSPQSRRGAGAPAPPSSPAGTSASASLLLPAPHPQTLPALLSRPPLPPSLLEFAPSNP